MINGTYFSAILQRRVILATSTLHPLKSNPSYMKSILNGNYLLDEKRYIERLNRTEKGGKTENDKVALIESLPVLIIMN